MSDPLPDPLPDEIVHLARPTVEVRCHLCPLVAQHRADTVFDALIWLRKLLEVHYAEEHPAYRGTWPIAPQVRW